MDGSSFLDLNFIHTENFLRFFLFFIFDVIVIYVIARLVYYRLRKNRDYLFTLFVFNLVIYFVCFILNNTELSIGVAFGIFAIFSILRYRTTTIPIKDMTYMFISISVAIVNGLGNAKIELAILLFINATFMIVTMLLEKVWVKNELMQNIIYEKIELIRPENHGELLSDLRERTGLDIHRFEIGQIDFLRDIVKIKVYYHDKAQYGDPAVDDNGFNGD